MHLVAARFRTVAAARAALAAIRSRIRVAQGDAGVGPLGSTRYDEPTGDFVLAGRFPDADVTTVVQIVAAQGGSVIDRRAEAPTPELAGGVASGAQARTASNPPWSAAWTSARASSRPAAMPRRGLPRKRLRRPAAPRVRAARAQRLR